LNGLVIRPAQEVEEGDGVRVRRLMPVAGLRNFDPFVLFDHFKVTPGTGFPPHPPRGFEAITYLFAGQMRHEDNLGNRSTVSAGGAQRFTAGRGLVHSEMPGADAAAEGIQLWINLPRRLKQTDPGYQQVNAGEFAETRGAGVVVRTLVGEGSPLTLLTPVLYQDVSLAAGAHWDAAVNGRGMLYLVQGGARVNGLQLAEGAAAFFDEPGELRVETDAPARAVLCAGTPHGEPILQHGPFVD